MNGVMVNINGDKLPQFTERVCVECPWRKTDGINPHCPSLPEGVLDIAEEGVLPLACHMTQKTFLAFSQDLGLKRCRGIEIYRANKGLESSMLPDTKTVFVDRKEALHHWPKMNPDWEATRRKFFTISPYGEYTDEHGRLWRAGSLV